MSNGGNKPVLIKTTRMVGPKKKNEQFLFRAVGVTDAEAKITEFMRDELNVTDFEIKSVTDTKVDQTLYDDHASDDHLWFQIKMQSGDLILTLLAQAKDIQAAIKMVKLAPGESVLGVNPKAYTHVAL